MRLLLFNLLASLMFSIVSNAQFKKHDNIKFDFEIERVAGSTDLLKVSAALYNPNKDTVYFLSNACDGNPWLIKYDSVFFSFEEPSLVCYARPAVSKLILPKGQVTITAYFKIIKPTKEVKLGFLFSELERFYEEGEPELKHDRLGTYIWAPVKSF